MLMYCVCFVGDRDKMFEEIVEIEELIGSQYCTLTETGLEFL